MCKRTMYKRARIPMFYGNDAVFLAPAKTARLVRPRLRLRMRMWTIIISLA